MALEHFLDFFRMKTEKEGRAISAPGL